MRILLLALMGAVIFVGISLPFAIPGAWGKVASVLCIVGGSAALFWVEKRTVRQLDKPGAWNDLMKSDAPDPPDDS